MSLTLVAAIAWLVLMPLSFWGAVLLLPSHLHRRASAGLSAKVADVVDLQAARDRRSGVSAVRKYRVL